MEISESDVQRGDLGCARPTSSSKTCRVGVDVGALRGTLGSFQTMFFKDLALYNFVLSCNAIAYKDILFDCVRIDFVETLYGRTAYVCDGQVPSFLLRYCVCQVKKK